MRQYSLVEQVCMINKTKSSFGSKNFAKVDMPRSGIAVRLHRLDQLKELLVDGQIHNVSDLASALSVSERTLARDVSLLRERGIAIESDVGRGGGIRLARHASVGDALLRESEALELLLALTISEVLGAGLVGGMSAIRSMVARAFAPADRARISLLRRRIWVASPVSDVSRSSERREHPASRVALRSAFLSMRKMQFEYVDSASRSTHREVEPHYLLWAWPYWFLLSWDIHKQSVRTFRLDRITQARVLPDHFKLRSAAAFKDCVDGVGTPL
jgi:predicted DNA-binding transcriptional regulator YafY